MFGLFDKSIDNIECMNIMFDYLFDLNNDFDLNEDNFRHAAPQFAAAIAFVCSKKNIK